MLFPSKRCSAFPVQPHWLPHPKNEAPLIIDGIIDWNAIKNMDLVINYGAKTVSFSRPSEKVRQRKNMFAAIRPIVCVKADD
ncbi:MAG TPA: hypothetical protein GX521_01835 [Firmicutes bacterium]|nr:hypothetical protein [Bacillota bacterium]